MAVFAAASRETRADQQQGGAKALAAALPKVLADGCYRIDRSDRFDIDGAFHQQQILAHEIEDLGRGEGLAVRAQFSSETPV